MDALFKERVAVWETDFINQQWVITFADGTSRSMTFDDWYDRVSRLTLSEKVPCQMREQFDTARNILLYSWFSYRLRTVAVFYSYTVLENALRCKLEVDDNTRVGLRALLHRAVDEGLLNDSGFSIPASGYQEIYREEGDRLVREVKYDPPPAEELRKKSEYIGRLCDSIPQLRNSLAHGKFSVHCDVLTPIMVHAEIINMLYDRQTKM